MHFSFCSSSKVFADSWSRSSGFPFLVSQVPMHKIKLGDGRVVDEYAYALPKSKGVVTLEVPPVFAI